MNNALYQLLQARKHLVDTAQYYEGIETYTIGEPTRFIPSASGELTARGMRLEKAILKTIDNLLDVVDEL